MYGLLCVMPFANFSYRVLSIRHCPSLCRNKEQQKPVSFTIAKAGCLLCSVVACLSAVLVTPPHPLPPTTLPFSENTFRRKNARPCYENIVWHFYPVKRFIALDHAHSVKRKLQCARLLLHGNDFGVDLRGFCTVFAGPG